MFLPYNTDAPVYHWPLGTVGLIAINVLVMLVIDAGAWPTANDYVLWYGYGLHPVQWVTSIFLHAGFGHLLGNMFFLWCFGLVVEGKLGWQRFVPLYLGLGALQSALEQTALLHIPTIEGVVTGSLGASAALFALMAVAVVWAPRNDIQCFGPCLGLFGQGVIGTLDVPIYLFAAIYVGWNAFLVYYDGFLVNAELLHLSGAIIGFAIGTLFVRLRWVECEDWDLYSLLAGRHIKLMDEFRDYREDVPVRRTTKPSAGASESDSQRRKAIDKLRRHLQERQSLAALQTYERLQHSGAGADLPAEILLPLTEVAWQLGNWKVAVPLMEACIALQPSRSRRIRVLLAEVLITQHTRPQHALRILEPLQNQPLAPHLETARQGIVDRCQQLIEDGVVELQSQPTDR